MVEVTIIAIVLLLAIFMTQALWEEWRAARRRRQFRDMKHVLGGKQWWGRR
jgi:hypothetical protein